MNILDRTIVVFKKFLKTILIYFVKICARKNFQSSLIVCVHYIMFKRRIFSINLFHIPSKNVTWIDARPNNCNLHSINIKFYQVFNEFNKFYLVIDALPSSILQVSSL